MEEHYNNKDIINNDITMEEFHVISFAIKVARERIFSQPMCNRLAILDEKIDKILEKGENHG